MKPHSYCKNLYLRDQIDFNILNRCKHMKRKVVFCSLFLCCAGLMSAQQTVNVDSLNQTVAPADSAVVLMADSAVAGNVEVDALADSIAIALRPLTQISMDSTKIVFDQVKELTDKISEQALQNAQLVQKVFSDTAIVNKYNDMLILPHKYSTIPHLLFHLSMYMYH